MAWHIRKEREKQMTRLQVLIMAVLMCACLFLGLTTEGLFAKLFCMGAGWMGGWLLLSIVEELVER